MVIVQIIIDIEEESEISCYILKREDAKEIEIRYAKIFEDFTVSLVKEIENQFGIKAKKTVIKDPDKKQNG